MSEFNNKKEERAESGREESNLDGSRLLCQTSQRDFVAQGPLCLKQKLQEVQRGTKLQGPKAEIPTRFHLTAEVCL